MWLILAGRGWGKTRTGATDIAYYALTNPETICAVVTPTFGDIRRVLSQKTASLKGEGKATTAVQQRLGYTMALRY